MQETGTPENPEITLKAEAKYAFLTLKINVGDGLMELFLVT
jgi:hypothetical protein